LKCPAKNVNVGYPLKISVIAMDVQETEADFEFLRNLIPTLNWEGVCVAANAVGLTEFPTEFDKTFLNSDDFLQSIHNLLLDIHILQGTLTCPETGLVFNIEDGIPNMM
jgi:multifunctional methyltransferase subunit TRM112